MAMALFNVEGNDVASADVRRGRNPLLPRGHPDEHRWHAHQLHRPGHHRGELGPADARLNPRDGSTHAARKRRRRVP